MGEGQELGLKCLRDTPVERVAGHLDIGVQFRSERCGLEKEEVLRVAT